MNELVIKKEQLSNSNLTFELLNDFYKSIDVGEETKNTYKKGISNFLKWLKENEIHQLDKKVILSYKS